jgi:hypothetical protein
MLSHLSTLPAPVRRSIPLAEDPLETASKDAARLGHGAQLLRYEHRVFIVAVGAHMHVRRVGAHFWFFGRLSAQFFALGTSGDDLGLAEEGCTL